MVSYRSLLAAALVNLLHLMMFSRPAEALKCLKCMAFMHESGDCSSGKIDPSECGEGFNYCIKYVGNMNEGKAVFRDCSKQDMQHQCNIKIIEQQKIHVCYTTCSTDGCNGGPISGERSSTHALYSLHSLVCAFLVTLTTVNAFFVHYV